MVRPLRMFHEAGVHHQGKETLLLLLLQPGHQMGRKDLSGGVGKIGAATIENTVRDQARKIFQSPYFLERISSKTGLTIPEVRSCFTEDFWNETNGAELNRIYSELFEKIILKEDQIVFEIKTAGIQALTEEVRNEHQ